MTVGLAETRAAWSKLTEDEQEILIQYVLELYKTDGVTPRMLELLNPVNEIYEKHKNVSVASVPEHVLIWRKKL